MLPPASTGPVEPRLVRAARGLPVDATPVWFMRQAGRYMPAYRAVREKFSLLEIAAQPELAAQVTLQPVAALGVDAAILFSDILLPLVPMGIHLEFGAGEGPILHNPIRSAAGVDALRQIEPREALANVLETLRLLRAELDPTIALIGFAGGPFTLASYLIEGGHSRNYQRTKQFLFADPPAWRNLMEKLSAMVADYLVAQVEAGAQVVQVFDSWVGALTVDDYQQAVLPYARAIFQALAATGAPAIHFGVGTASLLPWLREAGGDVIGVDWQTPLDWARDRLGAQVPVQGNLDPVALFAPWPELEKRVDRILEQAGRRPGHIFNLGHGILPETPVEAVRRVVERVHERTAH